MHACNMLDALEEEVGRKIQHNNSTRVSILVLFVVLYIRKHSGNTCLRQGNYILTSDCCLPHQLALLQEPHQLELLHD